MMYDNICRRNVCRRRMMMCYTSTHPSTGRLIYPAIRNLPKQSWRLSYSLLDPLTDFSAGFRIQQFDRATPLHPVTSSLPNYCEWPCWSGSCAAVIVRVIWSNLEQLILPTSVEFLIAWQHTKVKWQLLVGSGSHKIQVAQLQAPYPRPG